MTEPFVPLKGSHVRISIFQHRFESKMILMRQVTYPQMGLQAMRSGMLTFVQTLPAQTFPAQTFPA
ncbi:MAG: hypothetical protein ACPH89_10570, partial [Candidatus Puniceispirillaceae bacterium]